MILHVTIPVPDTWNVGPTTRMFPADAEVRDPASGVVGRVRHAHVNWRNGNAEIHASLEVDDDSAVAAALRKGPAF